MKQKDLLHDIEVRFLSSLKDEHLATADRLLFQIELAHWYYEDFVKINYKKNGANSYGLKAFAAELCEATPNISLNNDFDNVMRQFWKYKQRIPVYGCILLNKDMNKFLLVRNYTGNSWGFPKGKLNENESTLVCAVRETYEETGYDATSICNNNDYLSLGDPSNGRMMKLYIGVGVPEDTYFKPIARHEISKIEFFDMDELPKKHFNVLPFLPKLKKWITLKKIKISQQEELSKKKEKRLKRKEKEKEKEKGKQKKKQGGQFFDLARITMALDL